MPVVARLDLQVTVEVELHSGIAQGGQRDLRVGIGGRLSRIKPNGTKTRNGNGQSLNAHLYGQVVAPLHS